MMGDPVTMGTMALSLASTGLSAIGKGASASGVAAGDTFRAQQYDIAAQAGELKATQVGDQLTRNLGITLGNIDAVRAASRADPTSPTGAAVRDFVDTTETNAKNIQVDSIMAQAKQDEAGAAYERQAAGQAMLGGDLSIAGTLIGGMSGALSSLQPKKAGDSSTGLSLTNTGGLY